MRTRLFTIVIITILMPLTVFCQNRPPVWITDIEGIECSENAVILFTVEGDDPDGDDLTITFYSDDLPREVIFDDKGNGTGLFLWVPGFEDAGCYLANFVLSDNEFDVLLDIFITICNVNRPPWAYQFDEIPDSFQLILKKMKIVFLLFLLTIFRVMQL